MTRFDFAPIRDRLEADLRQVLEKDLTLHNAAGPYLVLVSETELKPCGWFGGLSHPSMHKWLRKDIGPRWKGNGPAVLLVDTTIARREVSFFSPENNFVGVAIHEVAHTLDVGGMFTPDVAPDGEVLRHTGPELFAATVAAPEDVSHRRSERHGHDSTWIRVALHLRQRMVNLGWEVPFPTVINREVYGYYPPAEYHRALGDEFEQLAEVPITLIRFADPPKRFTELYAQNLIDVPDSEI
jgi:hypothetical protein